MTFPADIVMSPAWRQFGELQIERRNAEALSQFVELRKKYDNSTELQPVFAVIDKFRLPEGEK